MQTTTTIEIMGNDTHRDCTRCEDGFVQVMGEEELCPTCNGWGRVQYSAKVLRARYNAIVAIRQHGGLTEAEDAQFVERLLTISDALAEGDRLRRLARYGRYSCPRCGSDCAGECSTTNHDRASY